MAVVSGANTSQLTILIGIVGVIVLLATTVGLFFNLPGVFTSWALAYWGPGLIQKIFEFLPGEGAHAISLLLLNINRAWPYSLRKPLFMFFGITLDLFFWMFNSEENSIPGLTWNSIKILGYAVIVNHLLLGFIVNFGLYQNQVCANFNNGLPACNISYETGSFVPWLFYIEILGLTFYIFVKDIAHMIGSGGGILGAFEGIKTTIKFVLEVGLIFVYLSTFQGLIWI